MVIRRALGLSALLCVFSCSFIVDTDELDEGCASGTKFCGGRCVDVNDATYGCTPRDCDPCQKRPNGDPFGDRYVPKCESNRCIVDRCAIDWGGDDCDKHLLTDEEHCGNYTTACPTGWTCRVGVCTPGDGAGGEGGAG